MMSVVQAWLEKTEQKTGCKVSKSYIALFRAKINNPLSYENGLFLDL